MVTKTFSVLRIIVPFSDLVFANSTCFNDTVMEKLALKGRYMQSGSFFLTTTKRLPSTDFELVEMVREKCGIVFLIRRLT